MTDAHRASTAARPALPSTSAHSCGLCSKITLNTASCAPRRSKRSHKAAWPCRRHGAMVHRTVRHRQAPQLPQAGIDHCTRPRPQQVGLQLALPAGRKPHAAESTAECRAHDKLAALPRPSPTRCQQHHCACSHAACTPFNVSSIAGHRSAVMTTAACMPAQHSA
jgi:hypothetical protein